MLKKLCKFITIILCLFILLFVVITISNNMSDNVSINKEDDDIITNFSVSENGWLKVDGSKLFNEKNQEIQLTGISSHGIKWYGDLATYENLKYLKDVWGINIFRVSMYSQNYVEDPTIKQSLVEIVDNVINLDMYVIIDWHILFDSNPNTYSEQANLFFEEMSLKYGNIPNVIYEICNEPNGNAVRWEEDIKPYAQRIITTIRNNSPKSLIIVGTPDWCKKLNVVADSPLNFENITYACHFYSGSHGKDLQNSIDYALSKNISIFVSECGLTDSSGNGQLYTDEFNSWINFLDTRHISWIVWSLSNKNESSAILSSDYYISDVGLNINDYLSEAGNYLKGLFTIRILK